MDDSELSRLLGLLSDRTALTGEYPNPLATNAKADHISSEEGARDVSQQTLSGSTTKLGKDTSKWYRDCPPDEEILVLGQFAGQIATERAWEHNRQVQFAKSKYKPTDPKKGDTAPSISSTITFQLDEVGPREWQHIPGRDIAMWDRDAVQGSLYSPQLDCASKLLQLKPGTLRYEPIDVEKFVSGIRNFLRAQGIFVPSSLSQSTGKWTLAAFRASLVLLAFGVQLQSAVILHELSFLWLETKVTDITIPSEDSVVLEMALKGLSTFPDGAACRLALPVSRCLIGSWITEVYRPSVRDAIACDGRFLYIYGRLGLLKIGTGAGDTLRNMVYSHCRTYCRAADVERSWLCLIGDSLYCRTITMPGHCVDRISLDFQTITPLLLGSSSTTGVSSTSVYAMVTDGTSLYTISCRDQLAFLKTPAPPMLQRSKAKRKEKTAAISALEANPIQVGNRVVRGPDWKWSNQDGEPGSVGTVERISTWGGVQGSGITVRWDKNQRMNTYRWGAEGCFDIQIVEEDASGNIVAQRPLKRDTTKPNGSPSRSLHQFVVCRYDPSQLSSYLDLPDESLHGLLNIASKVDGSVDPDAKPQLTKVHEHPVGESTLTTSWICDGQQAGCLGPSVPRYRCLEGCDYDLCASCFAATAKQDEQTSKSVDLLELPFAHEGIELKYFQLYDNKLVDDTFFQSEDDSVASEQEQQSRIAKLEEAWNGQYNYRECAVALLKHDNDVQKANEWLAASGALLKKRCIIPVCDSVLLEQNNMSFLDPVLLIAGSFYTTGSQLGIVVPFGICHIEATPRRRRNGDVLCVFSMATGTLLSDFNQVITIADIPAGSPMCYDASRDRLIGYSTTSQVLMEFSNMEYATPLNQTTEVPGLENPGGALLYHLTRIMGLRHLLSPIHFPVKTIEMQLQAIDTGKTKRRQIKKLHARLEMMKAFPDPKQGYFLPFCVDVQSLPSLSKALRHAVHFRWKVEYISQVLYLLVGLLEEAMPAGVVDFGSLESDVESLETLLVHLSRGEYCDQDIGVVARLAQRALLWGMIHQLFLQSSLKLRSSVRAWCSTIDVSIENASFLVLMPLSHPSRMYSNASQAKIGFVGSVLRTLASSTIFLDRLAEDPQEWIVSIFDLSDKESKVLKQDEVSLSPSQRLLYSFSGYMLQRPDHKNSPWVVKRCLEKCRSQISQQTGLRASMVGTILPLIVASLFHHPKLSQSVATSLEDLLVAIDDRTSLMKSCQDFEMTYTQTELCSFFSPSEVIESSHPYGLGIPTFRKQVHFPHAALLDFEFDVASRTLNSSDFLYITSNPYANVDRLSAEHNLCEDEYRYGQGIWSNYSLSGDSALMVLCASTHPMDHMGQDKQRYGFKCKVRGYYSLERPYLLRIQHSLAHLCSTLSHDSISIEPEDELTSLSFLANWNPIAQEIREIAQDVNHPLISQLEKQFGRIFLRQNDEWRKCVAACLAVFIGVSKIEIKCADSSEMKPIIEHLMRLQRYLMRQTQIENEWFYFITEDTNLDSVRDRLAENEELLHDLCVLQDIPVANTDQLIRKLEEAKASGGAISRSSTVRLVGELASLLLKRTNLFRSRINPTDIDKIIVQHQERGNQRLTGLKMLSRLLSLKSVSTRQYFLGILVSALKERKTRVSILDNCRLCDSDLALQLHQEAQSLMMKMKGYLEAPETLFSHKVLLAIDLTIIESSKMSESLFLQVAQLLQQTPTVKLTTESALGFPRPLSVQEERTRRLNAFDDILWMTFRRFLWENDVSLSLRMDACYTLFEHSRNASKKSRILNLVHSLSVQSQTLSEKWISAVTSIVVEFTQPPQVLRPAIRLLHTLEAPHDFGLIRRMLFGIGQCLLLVSDTTRSIDEDYATVLLYSSSCNEDLMKLVNELDTQLKPEISSWGLSLDANTFEKQQILMLDTSMVHRYVQCDGCGMNPLVGYRFKCQSCSNYDLCTACYVGKVHDMEHVFLRCSDSTGSGDQLPPRSTETLVGSRLWKTGLLQSELQSKGYVVVLTSSEHECKTLAEKISSLSLSSTVLGIAQVRRMQSLHLDKEGANLRNSHATALNAKASPCDFYLVKQELASLYTSLVRKWLQIKPQAVSAISASFKLVPKLFANCQSTSEVYEGIGALAIMGGAVEPLIENGHVKWENTTAIVREVFPQHVNLELANGRFEYDVKRSAVRPVSRTDLNPYLASLFLDLLNVFQQSLEGVLNWLKSDEICLVKSDLSWRLLKALEVLIPLWPSMSDNQVLAMYGNAPSNLMQLAQKSIAHGVFTQETDRTRRMVWELSRNMHTFLALGPTTGQSPVLNVLNDFTKLQQADDYQESTYWYNLYAYASMSDLPQDPGRNKLLDYWERHVIPAIQKYVRGSFKSYEMDYFFAQLREPLREGNNTAARRIAHTLCDGHVPPGCNFPEADTDWSALQWDDLEIGGCYRIALDTASSPTAMQWCDGQIGHVALIDPSTKLTLLQVVNPSSSCLEHWWLPVSQLQPGGSANPSITKYTTELYPNLQRSLVFDALQSARQCIFSMIRQCPELLTLESNTPQPGFALSSVLQICADQWSPLEMRKEHPVKDALHCHQSMIHPSREPSQKLSKKSKVLQNTAAPKEVLMKSIGGLVLSAITQAIQLHDSYVVTSTSPPEPLVRLHIPDASWMVLTFFVHPVLMDLPAGSGMEIFYDEDCTQLIRGYYGGRKGLNKLPPVWVTANTCYIKMSAAQYARYKFRVDGINRALGIATWLHDFMNDSYHWCSFLEQGNWPPLIQQVAFNALIPKMPRTLSPILSSKLKEQWQVVYAEENPVFSTYAQQLMEVMSLIQDNSAPIISPFRRMTKFAEAFTDPTKEGVVGRVPLEEIKTIVEKTQLCDYFIQRLIIVQRLPKTLDQDGLTRGISKWIVHLSLECCGEADDQSIFSATEVTRFGILANVLYCPVDENGYTRGFCIVDVGRDDIIDKLMTSLARNPFFFEGEHTEDDPVLMAYINQSENTTSAHQAEPTTWKCGACTLENSSESVVCSICEAPRPDRPPTTDNTESAVDGWTCGACTFLNSWGNPSCSVCDMPCDKERPTQANSDASSQDKEKSETPPSDANQHTLSVLKFKDAFDAGHDRDPRINEFLQSVLAPNTGDLGKLPQCPREMYLEIRSRGLDFQLTRSHFTSMENAIASMDKWTVAMDVQLIEMTRLRCHEVGMLNLTDLSPSHLLSVNPQFSLLVSLPLQEIRLRFLILQQWNILLCETLSLVDFHHLGTKLVALRKLIFPGVKIRFFNLVQDNMTQSGEKKPNVVLDRIKWKRDPTVSLFEVARKQLQAVNPLTFRVKRPLGASDPFIAFSVVFQGENVVGEGGPYRQLFSDLAHECIRLRIFQPTPNASLRIGEYRDMLIPRPSALSRLELEQYEFIGLLMGCCLRTGVHLPLRIAPIIWKCLVQQPLTLIDLKQIDQSLHDSLLCLQSDPNLLESLTFTTSLSDGTFVELVKDGADKVVTKANLSEYIRLVQQVRLNECKPQVDAILQGISKIVPLPLLPLCTWTELQQWVCGSQAIDIELLKRHTKYSAGMTVDKNPHLEYFWQALASFSDDDRRRFINFAWGQESLPADDAEFDRTRTRLLIKPPPATDKSQDSLLPKADTCFFNIELPAYSSLSTMKEKLLLAINLCTSMDADDQTARMDVFFDEE
ncbi:hypothetical protein LEN26_000015 [Aphanomyces euteiches]|nr:hypothetical protein LEN26_000015 [Aphanomyces euteiches]